MKYNDYKKYEGRWICNRCKEFLPQIKIRPASRKADKKRNSFCKKCSIKGTQFSLKRTYLIPTFLAWCAVVYYHNEGLKVGVDLREFIPYDSTDGKPVLGPSSLKGWIVDILFYVLFVYLCIQIVETYAQRRSRRTIRKLSRESNKK
tara:strand:- start:1322 stop:1762 length:441 start_codon:yes stop_codon:yes gene_type:complete